MLYLGFLTQFRREARDKAADTKRAKLNARRSRECVKKAG
jgi:hypothetical protein